ncbi:MAG: acyltransferase [Christensenella sp.]|nr:acyltransferase [Christensenella sp.]
MEQETTNTTGKPAAQFAAEHQSKNRTIDAKHIDVLDGVRALAVFGVLWFHFWQQNWIMPNFRLPFLESLGLPATVSLDFLPRAGFLFVDWLLFLSAFCLFLPYARAALDGAALPEVRLFYRKRIARIVPSYYVSVLLILLCVAIPSGAYHSVRDCLHDLIPTLTFTQPLFADLLIGTKLNGVLWTAAIEMQFYLFFPLLAWAFTKKPVWTYLGMLAVSIAYLWGFALQSPETIRTTVNQLPAFFGVFANGMAFAFLFVWLSRTIKRSAQLSLLSLVGLVVGFWMLFQMMKAAPSVIPVQIWQAENRFRLSLVFALITISAALTFSGVRWLFSNVVMRFLAGISYNVYIWHQWIAVKLKEWHIPQWSGEKPPNMTGDVSWQWRYTAAILVATFAAAILATYVLERPVGEWLLRRPQQEREPLIAILREEDEAEDEQESAEPNEKGTHTQS